MPTTIGGVERHVEEISTRLAARGFMVIAYARPWYVRRTAWSERMHRGVRVVVLPSLWTKHLDAISHTLLATLHAMREQVDVYHFHGVGPALLSWMPRILRPHARVVVTFHCVDRRHAKWGWAARIALAIGEAAACWFPHETITVGETLAQYCRARYRSNVVCIPNGVTMPSTPITEDADRLRAFGLRPRQYLLVVSRLVPHKGVHTVIDAFLTLQRERSGYAGYQLVIVGAPAFTEQYASELELRSQGRPSIRFLGQQTGGALDALFRNAALFVHGSSSEGLPMTLLEAAAAGVVPLVSNIPEHGEVTDRIGGFHFAVGDARDCAEHMHLLLSARASLPHVGESIRLAVQHHYDWDRIVARISDRYRSTDDTPCSWRSPLVRRMLARVA